MGCKHRNLHRFPDGFVGCNDCGLYQQMKWFLDAAKHDNAEVMSKTQMMAAFDDNGDPGAPVASVGESPVYKNAYHAWTETQVKQIQKGMEKYGRPLNPDEWTAEELGQHFFEESVDQAHYVEALVIKCRELQQKVQQLELENAELRHHLDVIKGGALCMRKKGGPNS